MAHDIDQKLLRELFDYVPETGVLTWRFRSQAMFPSLGAWKVWNKKFAGKEALYGIQAHGYRAGALFNRKVYAHRIIWMWVHGVWPEQVDHINHDRADNRLANLRDVSCGANRRNQRGRGKQPGVFRQPNGRWYAQLKRDGRNVKSKSFDTFAEAAAYRKQLERAEGYHENHGKG